MPVDFRSRDFLIAHIRHTMAFYHPRCIDPAGGFFHFFKDDGSIYDTQTRHLVSSTRFVFNYAMAYLHFGDDIYREGVRHGLAFLRDVHRNPETGGYAWLLSNGHVTDATNHCYGLAFVVLAYAKALEAGCDEARGYLSETWDLLETHFWDPHHGLYADEATADWQVLPYRGQNANMHACEALLAAYEASGEQRYLDRAATLADHMVNRQAALAGGLVYGFDPDGAFYDTDKYFWVQAESLATAALLAQRSGDAKYWEQYDALWDYSWRHFVDHQYGAWFRILNRDNSKISDEKSPAGKVDYHTMGACYEVLKVLPPAS